MGAFMPAKFGQLVSSGITLTSPTGEEGEASEENGNGTAGKESSLFREAFQSQASGGQQQAFSPPLKPDPKNAGFSIGAAAGGGSVPASTDSKKPQKRTLVAFVCGTAAGAYTQRAMNLHDEGEDAHLVCIHSVVVGKIWRGRRIGKALVETYLECIRDAEMGKAASPKGAPGPVLRKRGYETAACIAHEEVLPFLEACGFKKLGHSHVQWGSGDWIEMRRDIVPADMRKQADEDWAADDAEKQAKQREEELRWQAKKEAEKKAHIEAYLQGAQQAHGHDPDRKLTASPTFMETISSSSSSTTAGGGGMAMLQPLPPATTAAMAMNPASRSTTSSSQDTSRTPSDPGSPHGLSKGATTANSLSPSGSMSSSMLLNALRSHSLSASQANVRNPGQSFSAILGSALAGKTAYEDAFSALEARLVSRELGTNLADIYCPREECGCKIISVDRGMWEIREIGPVSGEIPSLMQVLGSAKIFTHTLTCTPQLSSPDLKLPNSPAVPMHPSPPKPPAHAVSPHPLGPDYLTTPGAAFWVIPTPVAFDNVGFSKDAKWRPLLGATITSPRAEDSWQPAMTKEEKKEEKRQQQERAKQQKEQEKRQKAERKETMRLAKRQNSTAPQAYLLNPPLNPPSPPRSASPGPMSGGDSPRGEDGGTNSPREPEGPEYHVKYLLCAECDCGPLGYTILPESMRGGGLANAVGQEINAANGAGGDGGEEERQPPRQEFLLASDRVRYKFPRAG